jgi:hypothetical protein
MRMSPLPLSEKQSLRPSVEPHLSSIALAAERGANQGEDETSLFVTPERRLRALAQKQQRQQHKPSNQDNQGEIDGDRKYLPVIKECLITKRSCILLFITLITLLMTCVSYFEPLARHLNLDLPTNMTQRLASKLSSLMHRFNVSIED